MRSAPIYDDLVIRFESVPGQGYRARVTASPRGASEPVALSPSLFDRHGAFEETLDTAIWRDGERIGVERDARAPATALNLEPATLGRQLFDALFSGAIRETFLSSFASVSCQEGRGLRISLELEPEVAGVVGSLPWELLYRFETRDFLSRSVRTPVIRRLEMNRSRLTPRPISALRVLVVLSNPERDQMLDVGSEKRLIQEALGSLKGLDLQFLERPTIEELRQNVRDRPFDVLHFAGHGGFNPEGEGILCFEDEDRQERAVTGSILADNLIGFGPTPRLVFLNACKTARLPDNEQGRDPYQGVASALLMAGVPAVIAMQFPITDRAATAFSGELYRALAQGDPLESAVVEGRLALHRSRPSSWEWATPVLFLGVPHGDLFQIKTHNESRDASPAAREDQAPSDQGSVAPEQKVPALESALEMLDFQRYKEAAEALSRLLENGQDEARVYFYRALALLGGRRPRSARPGVIHQIESDLWQAGQRLRDEEPAHLWFFQALIQYDFYRMNGLRTKPPTAEELLGEARAAPIDEDATYLQRLLDHAPTPPNPVRIAIEECLLASRS